MNEKAIAGTNEKWAEMRKEADEDGVNLAMRGRSSHNAGGRRKLSIVGMHRSVVVKWFLQVEPVRVDGRVVGWQVLSPQVGACSGRWVEWAGGRTRKLYIFG